MKGRPARPQYLQTRFQHFIQLAPDRPGPGPARCTLELAHDLPIAPAAAAAARPAARRRTARSEGLRAEPARFRRLPVQVQILIGLPFISE